MAQWDSIGVAVPEKDGWPAIVVTMCEDTAGYSERTFDGPQEPYAEYPWSLVKADPTMYLDWVTTTTHSQEDAKSFFGHTLDRKTVGFKPFEDRLRALDSLRVRQRGKLAITILFERTANNFHFVDGRHRAFWLASNGAAFVPLMVPAHQEHRFKKALCP